jgi:hypothetical protein
MIFIPCSTKKLIKLKAYPNLISVNHKNHKNLRSISHSIFANTLTTKLSDRSEFVKLRQSAKPSRLQEEEGKTLKVFTNKKRPRTKCSIILNYPRDLLSVLTITIITICVPKIQYDFLSAITLTKC